MPTWLDSDAAYQAVFGTTRPTRKAPPIGCSTGAPIPDATVAQNTIGEIQRSVFGVLRRDADGALQFVCARGDGDQTIDVAERQIETSEALDTVRRMHRAGAVGSLPGVWVATAIIDDADQLVRIVTVRALRG